ncbi:MAG: hypothetical protein H6576_18245 [Lewinellaceae bacterium]|nr:hypothetical protein [Saprospiraceae bacterium]MCB9345633.1 hypothetical protein [Lewinellaceae bacterium]
MKTYLSTLFGLVCLWASAITQVPQAFKYQAIVRNNVGQILENQNVNLKIDLIQENTVYSETHITTTNAFGLVNLEIGRGSVLFGQFDSIKWGNTPTNIQVSLDLTGGSNYQLMGTAELLSVPYALLSGRSSDTELPTNAKLGDILYFNGLAWQQLPAGAPTTVLTMGEDGKPFWKPLPSALDSLLKVTMDNGDVIYCYPKMLNTYGWGPNGIDIIGIPNLATEAEANMDFNGQSNTTAMLSQLPNSVGKLCNNLVAYGFTDWYMPAQGELDELYRKLGPNGSGHFITGGYWSSSEKDSDHAWGINFGLGLHFISTKEISIGYCLCIRR